jgi:2-oxoglutarate ferredoxin oxidoreductase subunit beta
MVVFEKPKSLTDAVFHYCPGCTHGIVHRLVAQAIDELGIEGRTIGIAPVGCSVLAYNYFTCDMIEASHGRAPAVATGVKRSLTRQDRLHLPGRRRPRLHRHGETVHAATPEARTSPSSSSTTRSTA